MSRKPNLGLSWPYRKVYTLDEVARMRCRFNKYDAQHGCMENFREIYEGREQWVRRRIPVAKVLSYLDDKPCDFYELTKYIDRRRSGGKFPAIVASRGYNRRKPWVARDGNHRVRAAQCVGDKYIDAFVPVKKPPRRNESPPSKKIIIRASHPH